MHRDAATRLIFELVELLIKKDGSDIFITAGSEPAIKIKETIHRIGSKKLNREQADSLVRSIMNDRQCRAFDANHEANFGFNLPDVARFRISAFQQRGSTGMVLRFIKSVIPTAHQLGLPPLVEKLAMVRSGLVLVIGATGSGKSTTLAAMLDHRNRNSANHIMTLEDPIEYFHRHQQSIVNQREVGTDAESYAIGLKNALRQAPDVMLIGEIRDRTTMEAALNFAETGHLVLASLHSSSTDQAFDRIVNMFPGEYREQILMDLAFNLKAMIGQRLIARSDTDGLVPAIELLLNTPQVADLIFQNRLHEIKAAIGNSSEQGLFTFNQSLFELYDAGKISYESALRNADSVNDLRLMIRLKSKRARPDAVHSDLSAMQIEQEAPAQHLNVRLN